jgi:4-amino-4-deoxy-L-arabinose transferase-like glycosyltransferase
MDDRYAGNDGKAAHQWLPGLIVVVLAAVLLRIVIWQTYQPAPVSDSQGYLQVANMFYTESFAKHYGARAPAYPLLLRHLGMTKYGMMEAPVRLFQAGLGVLMALLWYGLAWRQTRNRWFALGIGLVSALILSMAYFETLIMTEVVSAFLVVVFFWMAGLLGKRAPMTWIDALLLGFLVGLMALTRPIMLYLAPLLLVYLYLRWRDRPLRMRLWRIGLYLLPVLVMVLGWSWFNWRMTGYFSITTLAGFNLINHTGKFIEQAPPEYAEIAQIYLRHRAERVAQAGNQSMTIWRAYDDLVGATGLSYVGLSQRLSELSGVLIRQHPWRYTLSVSQAWLGYWKVPIYWFPERISYPVLADVQIILWQIERYGLIAINMIFWIMGGYWMWLLWRGQAALSERRLAWLYLLVMAGAFAQALMDYGENPRYGVPFQMVIVWCVALGVYQAWQRWRT